MDSLWKALRNLACLPKKPGLTDSAKADRLRALVVVLAAYYQGLTHTEPCETSGPLMEPEPPAKAEELVVLENSEKAPEVEEAEEPEEPEGPEHIDIPIGLPFGVHRAILLMTADFSEGGLGPLRNRSATLAIEAVGLGVLTRLNQLESYSRALPLPLNPLVPPASLASGKHLGGVPDVLLSEERNYRPEFFFGYERLDCSAPKALQWIDKNLPLQDLLSWRAMLPLELTDVAEVYSGMYDATYEADGTLTLNASVLLVSIELVMRSKTDEDWVSRGNWVTVAPRVLDVWPCSTAEKGRGMGKSKGSPIVNALRSCDLAESNKNGNGLRLTKRGLDAVSVIRNDLSAEMLALIEKFAKRPGGSS